MSYNLTGIGTNSTGLLTFVQNVNTNLVDGMLGNFILFGVVILFWIAFYQTTANSKKAFTVSCWIGFILALIMRMVDLTSDFVIYIFLIGAVLSLAFLWKE